ncbi:MAG: hypothetical protein R8P61_15095 [Bacteroidia bacterium]|nr:hypothetical protein [Bacteroidia bacterium]
MSWGPLIPKKKSQERPKVVAQLEDSFIALRRFRKIEDKKGKFYNDQFELIKFDNLGKVLKKNVLSLKGIPQNPENLSLIYLRNELFAIYEYYQSKQENYVWEKRSIDIESLSFKEDAQEISRSNSKEDLSPRSYSIKASRNENFLLFYREKWNPGESKRVFFGMMVFDQNFSKILDKTIKKEVEDKVLAYGSVAIDDQGDVYFGLLIEPPSFGMLASKAKVKETRTSFRLYHLKAQAYIEKSYELELSGAYIAQMEIDLDPNGKVFGKGLYGEYYKQKQSELENSSEEERDVYRNFDRNTAHGIITFREEDLVGTKISPRLQAFTETFAIENIPHSRIVKNKGMTDFFYHKFKQGSDSFIFLEKFKSEVVPGPSASFDMSFSQTVPLFNDGFSLSAATVVVTQLKDIILLKISETGEIEWHKTLPKFQRMGKLQLTEQKWSYGSFGILDKGNSLVLALNDGPINFQQREKAWPYSKPDKMEMISLLHIDEKGEVKQEVIEESKKEKFKLVPNCFSDFEATKNNGIYYAENAKGYKWGFLK